jgi:hypothetical protein
VQAAATQANLGSDYRAIRYERPLTLSDLLFGSPSTKAAAPFDPARLSAAATPRLWYLAPQTELAGILTAVGRKE